MSRDMGGHYALVKEEHQAAIEARKRNSARWTSV
jgi:hypothetical protein